MSLRTDTLNPLNILGLRKLNFIPDHFKTIELENSTQIYIKNIEHWIEYNLNSRYALKQTLTIDQDKKIISVFKIGVEDPKEITMLSLGCPYLYRK